MTKMYEAVITVEGKYHVITVEGVGATQALTGNPWGIPDATHDMIHAMLDDPDAEILVSYTWGQA